ncbi:hypothetical protein OG978_05875 [Streptomyces sp. NBC_01591]|uniref:hypothetical protein n=1 Tax=Streptomyces sp. NBC_01591 TaxID=2975888 RepID=UPI002DDB38C8|nr:hypothetical protein [Streptomyces sp. NBC_01591]WSD66950.1 hypothetical protein OG978_05875 [Streptomyces sp. NBC_01591]
MGWVPSWLRKPLFIGLPLVLLVTGAVLYFGVDRSDSSGHSVANRAQLKRACAGLLPYEELRGLVPDDVAGEVSQYGTMLQPDQESRSLVNCSLTWPGHGSVRVRAVALISRLPSTVRAEDILPGGDDEGYEAPGVTGRVGEDGRTWVVAECPGGLEGRVREVSGMYVTAVVDLPVPDKGKPAGYLADFRTAVQVANGIAAAQNCGGSPLKMPTRVIDTYVAHVTKDADGGNMRVTGIDVPGLGVKKCRGLGKRAGFPGTWTASGDLQDSRLLSVCEATILDREDPIGTDPTPPDGAVVNVSAASWAGPLSESADGAYHRTGDSFAFREGARTKVIPQSESHELALWAGSECAAGTTYHRVTVRTEPSDLSEYTLSEAERTKFSKDARKLMDSYLADPDGWPGQQRCHDTKILGEVEGWR